VDEYSLETVRRTTCHGGHWAVDFLILLVIGELYVRVVVVMVVVDGVESDVDTYLRTFLSVELLSLCRVMR